MQAGRQARARAAERAAEQAAEIKRPLPAPVAGGSSRGARAGSGQRNPAWAAAGADAGCAGRPTPARAARPQRPSARAGPGGGFQRLWRRRSGRPRREAAATANAAGDKLNDNERFSERIAGTSVETTRASRLSDPARVAPQGTVIPAVLETAINSDTPGFARAVVSRDVKGFDGTRVLIPRGSKLVGQYKSGVADGQSRAFVVWSRILTPEGVSIDVDSPAADQQGRGGLTGEVDEHFFRRFGGAILLSVLSGGIDALASRSSNGSTAIVIGSPTQATQLASVALQKQIDIPVTIKVPQGEPIRVFVARDLDFSAVEPTGPR